MIENILKKYYTSEKDLKLEVMNYFDEIFKINNDIKVIHIAGTNGKGSCCEILNKIMIDANYKVGKFISPHLIRFNERISINNKEITDNQFLYYYNQLQPIIEKFPKKISFFSILCMVALLYFKENNVDLVILETGIGGRFDSTNFIKKPLVSIITSIGYDHTDILGKSLEEITFQKAGIIKKNSDTVIFDNIENIINIIKEECDVKNNNLHIVKKVNKGIKINLIGDIQKRNASIIMKTIEILNLKNFNIYNENISNGMASVIHKGRFETISNKPLIIYDGAHNQESIDNFINNVNTYYNNYKKIYIISVLKKKNYEDIIKKIISDDSIIIFTEGSQKYFFRAKEELYDYAKKYSDNIMKMELNEAIKFLEKFEGVTFVIGTLYLYQDVINLIKKVIPN